MRRLSLILTGYFFCFFLTMGIFSLTINKNNNQQLVKNYKNTKEEVVANNEEIEVNEVEEIDYVAIKNEIDSYRNYFNNEDIIGTLKIPGTKIDTFLVQGNDNDFYLNHALDKKYNMYGSTFLDYRVKVTDRKLIFYGHNSKTLTTIFKELGKYVDPLFHSQNPYIELLTEAGYETYKIFSIMVVLDDRHTNISFNNKGFDEHLKWMKDSSLYETNVPVNNNDKIITLQTCYYEPDNSYLLVNAKKV